MRILAALCLILVLPLAALAEDAVKPWDAIAELERKIAAEEQKIADLEAKMAELEARKAQLEQLVDGIRKRQAHLKSEWDNRLMRGTMNDPAAKARLDAELDRLEQQLEDPLDQIGEIDFELGGLRIGIDTARRTIATLGRGIAAQRDRIYDTCRALHEEFRSRKDRLIAEAREGGPAFAIIAAMPYLRWSEAMLARSREAHCDTTVFGSRIADEEKAGRLALADLIAPACADPAAVPAPDPAARERFEARFGLQASDQPSADATADICRRFGQGPAAAEDPVPPAADPDAYRACLCACAAPPGGQFTCTYDTEDKGWSPSCRELSNGPCICKAYGCFRAALPASGPCVEDCKARFAEISRPVTPAAPRIEPPAGPKADCLPGQPCFQW